MSEVKLSLCDVWLNDALVPSDLMAFEFVDSLDRKQSVGVRIQDTGNRRRVIRSAGQPREWSLALTQCTRTQLDWLEAHIGRTVCVRDHRGHKFYAVYVDTSIAEDTYYDDGDLTLTLTEASFSEVV